jgi:hypothetical protein
MRTCYLYYFDGVAWFLGLTFDFAKEIEERFKEQRQKLDYLAVMEDHLHLILGAVDESKPRKCRVVGYFEFKVAHYPAARGI